MYINKLKIITKQRRRKNKSLRKFFSFKGIIRNEYNMSNEENVLKTLDSNNTAFQKCDGS